MRRYCKVLLILLLVAGVTPAFAQQTGSISGKVVDSGGGVLPGVTVEATADVLPSSRTAVTTGVGDYRLVALPPGDYKVTFTLVGMTTVTRQVRVQLSVDTEVNATLGVQGVSETVNVVAQSPLIDKAAAEIKSDISSEQIRSLPVGQEYRDLIKLIPGVQYTPDSSRGPSAGASGQDNVYNMDGVNVTMPLYGTLGAEPASHDIAQVTVIKGGARAVDFNRAGGFSVDSVSKSGTNRFAGQFSYQLQNNNMAAAALSATGSKYNQDRSWLTLNGGGPLLPNKLFFYGSYYRPQRTRNNRANLYGELPKYESTRNEGFGKLTFTPSSSVLVNGSYRGSHRLDTSDLFAANAAGTTGSGNESSQKIATADASWIISSRSYINAKYTHFANPTKGRPDTLVDPSVVNLAIGTRLDLNNLDKVGQLQVPTLIAGNAAANAVIQPLINRYGYSLNGVQTGGGSVGYSTLIDNDDFYRDLAQVQYNLTLGSAITHELHAGFQWSLDAEELLRGSNGWGSITVPAGTISAAGQPIYYQASVQQQGIGAVPRIRGEFRSHNFEFNDTIRWGNLTINAGVIGGQDVLYGQGLREDGSTLSGYVTSVGTRYKMYTVPVGKMWQPRFGATWAYNGKDTVYGSFARYIPAASSLPRAASWDRNLAATIQVNFDQNGTLFNITPLASSSGKLFVPDMSPRTIDEFLVGTSKELSPATSMRAYFRYRNGSHFWEDTNNNARVAFNPPAGIPQTLYVPNLSQLTGQIGSGSSYVIAELDGAYTKYYEGTVEAEWRGRKAFVRGSATFNHYYGNFDQDASAVNNDALVFIGSSNIGDGAGRQLWDFKDGTLHGDRPYAIKLYGFYQLNWNASVGAFAFAQAGQPWEAWNYLPYANLTTNTSETDRYAEPAGSRRTPGHAQLDLNYTQNFPIGQRVRAQVSADLFNVFDSQTGYNYEPRMHNSLFGTPRNYYDPRVFQVAIRLQF